MICLMLVMFLMWKNEKFWLGLSYSIVDLLGENCGLFVVLDSLMMLVFLCYSCSGVLLKLLMRENRIVLLCGESWNVDMLELERS